MMQDIHRNTMPHLLFTVRYYDCLGRANKPAPITAELLPLIRPTQSDPDYSTNARPAAGPPHRSPASR